MMILSLITPDCQDLDREFNCKKNVRRSCISNSFANDSIINCLEPYCSDERLGCLTSPALSNVVEEATVINNLPQIFLSAITSLLLTMLCCGGFLYIVFKIRRCVSPQPASQTTATTTTTRANRRRRRRNDHRDGEVPEAPDASPSAPPIDKDDLPPSYDALFPERPKPEAPNT